MRHVPGWALLAAVCAPLLLVGAWSAAEALQGPGYDPATTTISVLAAYGAPGYWLMTAALLALGACYMTIAAGLRPAARAGRLALGGRGSRRDGSHARPRAAARRGPRARHRRHHRLRAARPLAGPGSRPLPRARPLGAAPAGLRGRDHGDGGGRRPPARLTARGMGPPASRSAP
ncbi:DUF998 domain-containing protein [Streptomyces sp. SA3_actF]|uniref:DUF998 domain-containing protein n=1 Tax=Streptomyces sp. SA3_actF TaxID=682181 RepID=UPI0002F62C12